MPDDDRAEHLKALTQGRSTRMNTRFEEWATQALTDRDVERRLRLLAAAGDIEAARRAPDRLDAKTPQGGLRPVPERGPA